MNILVQSENKFNDFKDVLHKSKEIFTSLYYLFDI